MDHDDNDFQGQNLQLAGEGNSNFSPVLRPYALHKFDFDDSLNGHLRFDTLVENEVFLGIPNQEDNQWIEDFSRGNSEIEFNSGAAEACSISRRHNVWSEATSSESVEMLLKSVGQGEMIVAGQSDGCNDVKKHDKIDEAIVLDQRDVVSEENLAIDGKLKNLVEESVTESIQESLHDVDGNDEQLDEREVSNMRVENANDLPEEIYIKSSEADCNIVITSEILSKSCEYDIASNKVLLTDSSLIFTEETTITEQYENDIVYEENTIEISTDIQMDNKTDKTVENVSEEVLDQKIEEGDNNPMIQKNAVVDGSMQVYEETVLPEQGNDVLDVQEVEKENPKLPTESVECNYTEEVDSIKDYEDLDASQEKQQGADQSEEQQNSAATITEDKQDENKIDSTATLSARNESSVQKVNETFCIASDVSEIVNREVVHKGSEELESGQNYEITIIVTDKAGLVEKNNVATSSQVTDALTIPDQSEDMNKTVDSLVKISPLVDQEANQSVGSDSQLVEVNTAIDPIALSEDGANCGSPIVISGIEVSHCERDKHEKVESLSKESDEKVQSVTKENEFSKEEKSFTFEVNPSIGLSEAETDKELWKSFPTVQACKVTMIEGSPSHVGQINILTPQEAPQSSPQAIELGSTRKVTPERKPRRNSAKLAGKEVGKKGTQAKEKIPTKELDRKLLGLTSPLGTIHTERSGAKESVSLVPASNLPDLNTSVSPASLFQQPFTDVQQVQLRAQIFVYGSLIQGAAPDETCMVSAFGPSETGRGVWEPKWLAYLERIHGQKSNANTNENPAQPRLGSNGKSSDQLAKNTCSHQSNILLTSPLNRPATKSIPTGTPVGGGTPQSAVNSMIPLSSPLWNLPTPTCERNPLLDYHQSLSPLNTYQPPPPARKFVASSNPSWLSQSSYPNPWMPSPQSSNYDASSRFAWFPVAESVKLTPGKEIKDSSPLISPIPLAHSVLISSTEPKSRKRKKVLVTEDLTPQIHATETKKIAVTEDIGRTSLNPLTKKESASTAAALFSTSIALTTSPSDHVKRGEHSGEKMDDVEAAKTQAEEAVRNATIAVTNCEELWSRLGKQKNSGLVSDNAVILAGAAMTVSAAAEVAKAAAAAAQIASNAAVQAKLMVDEALASTGSTLVTAAMAASPAILKGGDNGRSNSSIISAAKEAARKHLETASAASKHAENLDLVVKAAELAAEAVSQVGKIVAMGDPLTLAELLDLGPEEYRKQFKTRNSVENVSHMFGKQPDGQSDKEIPAISHGEHNQKDISMELQESRLGTNEKMDSRGEMGKTGRDFGSISTFDIGQDEFEKEDDSSSINIIKQGCLVEVLRDCGNGITGWYSARVLRLKDEKAIVGYTELRSDKEQIQEWVPLHENGDQAPKIRIAHHYEGTRKRRRSEVMDYAWSIGDRLDAWVDNCWCEGVVTELNPKDDTVLIIRFPAQGEKPVKVWDVRPILVYKDGEWTEWSGPMVADRTFQGDGPKEKRMKLGSPSGEQGWKNNNKLEQEKKSESTSLLPLSINENTFNVGKSTTRVDKEKLDVTKSTRTTTSFQGLSGVNIGVPKPGKKRKFMAVSEHYTSSDNSSKSKALANNSVKFTNYLMKQGGRELRSKAPRSSGKPPIVSARTLPQKINQPLTMVKNSVSNNSNDESELSGQPKSAELEMNADFSEGMVFSSKPLPQEKPKSATSERIVMTNKLKSVPGKSMRTVEVKEKSTAQDAILEPQRRSNRRIQPTSRLLEGLQSSLIISKMPSTSHDKTHRPQNRGTSKGN